MIQPLLEPTTLGSLNLKNKVVMAPMTRCRTTQPGDIPNEMMAQHYAQRASAGLIIAEATQISPQGQGYSFTPGIYSKEQIKGWKKVVDEVHQKGGTIFLQLWHVGRMSHEMFHGGAKPVAPSAIAPDAKIWAMNPETGKGGMIECPVPRALEKAEIKMIVEDYKKAAKNAIEAGFDGVEIHGANGYLIDQFLRTTSNQREDEYGGSQENRMRFALEVCEAVASEVGSNRVGIRLAPYITQKNMNDPEIIKLFLKMAKKLNSLDLLYIHLSEADFDDMPTVSSDFRHEFRKIYQGKIIVAGRYTKERGNELLEANLVDLVAFGRPFISNPDLVKRFKEGTELSKFDADTFFGGDEKGYLDYPNA